MLVPKDPRDDKNIFLEIRAGAGGDEAGLFAAELFRMYSRYAEKKRWKVTLLDMSTTGVGGAKEVVAQIQGKGVYQQAQIRKRSAPGTARSHHRGKRQDPYFHRNGGRHSRGRGRRCPDRAEGLAHRHLLLIGPRRTEREHDLLSRSHHPYSDRRSGRLPG